MPGTMLKIKQAELTLGKPHAKAPWGTGQTNELLFSQSEPNSIKNLIPLIWLEALQQASSFNSPAGQAFV